MSAPRVERGRLFVRRGVSESRERAARASAVAHMRTQGGRTKRKCVSLIADFIVARPF